MRRLFAQLMFDQFQKNDKLFLCTADLGFGMWDKVRDNFPDRFMNFGASEQLMLGAATGLSYRGFTPVCYSITPFLLSRGYEWIRNYINHESLNIKLIGGGRDDDYSHDGFTHYAGDDADILRTFKNIKTNWPDDESDLSEHLNFWMNQKEPTYINLIR